MRRNTTPGSCRGFVSFMTFMKCFSASPSFCIIKKVNILFFFLFHFTFWDCCTPPLRAGGGVTWPQSLSTRCDEYAGIQGLFTRLTYSHPTWRYAMKVWIEIICEIIVCKWDQCIVLSYFILYYMLYYVMWSYYILSYLWISMWDHCVCVYVYVLCCLIYFFIIVLCCVISLYIISS